MGESLVNLCKFCNQIIVEMSNSSNISESVLRILSPMITKITNSKLKVIKLQNICNKCDDKDIKLFKYRINKLNWDLTISKMNEQKYTNKYQYVIFKKEKKSYTKMFKDMFIAK